MLKRSRRLSLRDLFSISENLVEFRRRSGERNKICFLPRHALGRKLFSPRKRAKWPNGVPTRLLPCGERSSPDIREVFRLRETELGVRDCDDVRCRGVRSFRRKRLCLFRRADPQAMPAGTFVFVRNFYQPLAYMATMFFRISTTLSICSTQASSSGPWKLPAPVPRLGQGRPM